LIIPVVAGIIFDKMGRILLAQRREEDPLPMKWEFPGGKIKEGESPEECLLREIHEELGLEVIIERPFHVVNHSYPERDILLIAYLCRYDGGKVRLSAHRDYRWVDPERLDDMDLAPADIPIVMKLIGKLKEISPKT
jgi:8-oxo-dGTP diphosphatase